MLLKDKVAVITGGARGIGREIAILFAKEGADVAVCDIQSQTLADLQAQIESLGRGALTLEVDVSNAGQVDEMANKILDKFGKIDILINNAGITRDGLLLRMSQEDWDEVLNVNLKGTFNCTRAIARVMVKQRSGRIINISSVIGIVGNPGQANYAASKAGVIGFTKAIAKELASRNIKVNAIAPGFIQTEMTARLPEDVRANMLKEIPLNKFGTPLDVANVALFLASGASDYITGQVIQVDGGMVG